MTDDQIPDDFPARCDNCQFGDVLGELEVECRRHAPTPFFFKEVSEVIPLTEWPLTRRMDWCGEWALHPDKQQLDERGS